MATNNAANLKVTNNSDGYDVAGGTTARKLTVTGADITLTGSGTNVYTFPAATDTLVGLASTDTLTNKTLTTPVINGLPTGTGVASAATASTLVSRDASANISANNLIDGTTTTATAAGTTTLSIASTGVQIFTGSSTQTVKLPTTSVVFGTQYTIINRSTGLVTVQSSNTNSLLVMPQFTSATFTALSNTPVASTDWYDQATNVFALTGKFGTFNNSLVLAGTDSTTMTFPSTSATIARTDAANTFTGNQTVSLVNTTPQTLSVTTNAATADINHGIQNFTNSSAAAMTITLTTTSAVDGQFKEIRIYDFSAVAEGITWVGTENSTVTAPTTSNGSTTLPLSVLFQFNGSTSKWRCIASA